MTRRLSRADVAREHTLEWLMQRDDAERRPCETCRAAAGVTCANVHTGRPLTWQPAHDARLRSRRSSPGSAPGPGSPTTSPARVARAA